MTRTTWSRAQRDEIDRMVASAQERIAEDAAAGVVRDDAASFRDLHRDVDANAYLLRRGPGGSYYPEMERLRGQDQWDFAAEAIERLNRWLSGRPLLRVGGSRGARDNPGGGKTPDATYIEYGIGRGTTARRYWGDVRRMAKADLQELGAAVDPNGTWSDRDYRAEFGSPQTKESLLEAVRGFFTEDGLVDEAGWLERSGRRSARGSV